MPVVAHSVGIRRLVIGGGIPYPLGNPDLSPDAEQAFRDRLVQTALQQLLTSPADHDVGKTT